ncbi:hypothetical protein D3C75_1003310 [compost metagenome]
MINKVFMEVQMVGGDKVALHEAFARAYEQAVIGRLVDFNPFDPARTIQVEHMAWVYAKVMQEAGVQV